MQVNPVHALLAIIRQQARSEAADDGKVISRETVEEILAGAKNAQFRLEILERLVEEQLTVRNDFPALETLAGGNKVSRKTTSLEQATSGASDAINQATRQSHGRAWHLHGLLWDELGAGYLKYQVLENGAGGLDEAVVAAQKFIPSVEDIEQALFSEDVEPAEFARAMLAQAEFSRKNDSTTPAIAMAPFLIGFFCLLLVWYLLS